MLTLNADALAHLAQESRRLTVCGKITKADASVLRCTQFDDDIHVASGALAGTYLSTAAVTGSDVIASSDLSSDNLEIQGIFATMPADSFGFTGFTVADVVAGLFRNAVFTLFICQWDNPSAWQKILRTGQLGQISRTAEGSFTAEWRGLAQQLQQNIGRVYSELCDVVNFCDARCGLAAVDFTFGFTVTSVVNRRSFVPSISGAPSPALNFDLGKVKFLSGANNGYTKQIKLGHSDSAGTVETWEPFPHDIAPGDAGTIMAGCNRLFSTCKGYGNTDNFRGHGFWIPGMPKIIRAPGL